MTLSILSLTKSGLADANVPQNEGDMDELVSMWNYPSANELIDTVLAKLPAVPIRIEGELRSKPRHGNYRAVATMTMVLQLSATSSVASYEIRDFFGGQQERLDIQRHADHVSHEFRVGESFDKQPFPGLSEPIRNTELTWGDLSLSFLWWKGGTTRRQARIRGRSCYVVELPAPPETEGQVRYVDVWIDPKIGMLLRADSFSESRKLIRRLSVKRFRKIDDVWLMSELGVTSFPGKARTSLRITDVSTEPFVDMDAEPVFPL